MREEYCLIHVNAKDYFFYEIAKENNMFLSYKSYKEYKIYNFIEKFNVYLNFSRSKWRKKIKKIDKVIIFDSGWSEEITRYIKRMNSSCYIHVFLYNKISNENHHKILSDKNVDRIWSFDIGDVKKFNLSFNGPFYTKHFRASDTKIVNDIVFVGAAKNRRNAINKVKYECELSNLRTNFHIINDKADYISYDKYVDMIRESKCILDITNEGQQGLSLRFMEALFFSKKLITNNKEVKKYEFYNSNNIYILDVDNYPIKDFLNIPFEEYEEKYIKFYDINSWIERFVEAGDVNSDKR